ncbi:MULTISPECIES: MerR family transcriptional regulator [Vagococcus]|uniref:Transcriptional regulator, MerR family n=1 Tax=Vagococcus fluvialis bH819 TaxID=1255619 RepID=A0A1X6WMM2_9ENTE|nr:MULTISPECIES: MerR family transcriptional regulator [Vagococcus]SLM85583.1 Transcriptional regulator, MerR family [Vagococcus fluvialis bH819]HCM89552.1 MerR family transcriptional regulator [Vagococcus sp.]
MYTIGEVSKITHISTDTLRYYDKIGLLPFVKRNESGHRSFSETDLKYLEVIQCLKLSDVPVKEIGQFVEWTMMGDSTLIERKDFFTEKEQALEAKIESLEAMLSFLKWKKWYYETACEAKTETIHFKKGTKSLDPEVLKQYNQKQSDDRRKISDTPRHYK